MKQITKRLKDAEDLREGIEALVREHSINAGTIVSCVGSLSRAHVRMPRAQTHLTWNEALEIVSVTGTVSKTGIHIHISFSDIDGKVFGGHLSKGCIVRNTTEIILLSFEDTVYSREPDRDTGFDELVVK